MKVRPKVLFLLAIHIGVASSLGNLAFAQNMDWMKCLRQTAFTLGHLHKSEPAETLVKATIAECRNEELKAYKDIVDSGLLPTYASETVENIKKGLFDDLVATVLRGRLYKN